MPAFIKTPADEARWSKAKKAANETLSESAGDSYWALVNSIYQKMKKSTDNSSIDEVVNVLEKARRRLSDEPDSDDDSNDDLGEGFREFDPEEEESAGADWLKENDPDYLKEGDKDDEYSEYSDDEDEDAHQQSIEEDLGDLGERTSSSTSMGREKPGLEEEQRGRPKEGTSPQIKTEESAEEVSGKRGRFRQPSREELNAIRAYTRPWEHRARETARLQADPSKNPVLAHQGNIIEARNKWHADRKNAYQQLTSSNEYQSADPVAQMEMDDKFENEWRSKNPEHLMSAMQAHGAAHEKGKEAKELHAAAKDARIRNILEGGVQAPETFSTEEGLQHAGGIRGEEGTEGTIVHDPATSFAMGNQDFIKQYAKDYNQKSKRANLDDIHDYNEGSKRDINRILGKAPGKDPAFENFFSHYHPLIGMSAHRTLNRLGIDPKSPDIDMSMLHEAGMHGLIQAINDYDHDNPSQVPFSTHAGNKIRGLQMTAMRNIDKIPAEVRQAQKRFAKQGPKVDLHQTIKQTGHPAANDMSDRLRRIGAQREAQIIRRKGPQGGADGNS